MPGSGMSSDVTRGEGAAADPVEGRPLARLQRPDRRRLRAVADRRRRRPARAADRGSPLHLGLGRRAARVRRLARRRIAYLRSTPTEPPDLWLLERAGASSPSKPRRLTTFNAEVLDELELREPVERHVTVDGRDIQGWLDPRRRRPATARRPDPRRPAHALRLVAVVGVPDPRGGRDRCLLLQPARVGGLRRGVQRRQPPRLGPGSDAATSWPASTPSWPTAWPTPIDSASPAGSYGGYLTSWIVGHDQRFRAAMTCRSRQRHGRCCS